MSGNDMKRRKTGTKKKLQTAIMTVMLLFLLSGCTNSSVDASVTEEAEASLTETAAVEEAQPVAAEPEPEETTLPSEETTPPLEELGNPRSSYGLGSAAFLKGRNILVSLFVTTPESSWTDQEQNEILQKLGIAVDYIEEQAGLYGVSTELMYDWSSQCDLKIEAETDFKISEDVDFVDRLDEEIALWFEEKISYEKLLEDYQADGIVTCVFVNNPGISYAIVFDGTDNEKESMILFSRDYYRNGQKENAAAYAHEILHVFGAHDLYEDAEFTKEVTDYVSDTYPNEIMFTVSDTEAGKITQIVSPVTAYHLGWISYAEEIDRFPQLNRSGNG